METVLVGMDPPPAGPQPLRWAAEYCRSTGGQLVAVIAHQPPSSESTPDWYEEQLVTLRKRAEAALDGLRPAVPHALAVRRSDSATAIAELVADDGAAMVVVGAPGTDGFGGLALGTHDLPVPFLVVPAMGGPLQGSPVVVGLEGSSADSATLGWTVRLAAALGASVCAVYASDAAAMSPRRRRGATTADDKEMVVRGRVAKASALAVDITTIVEHSDPVTAVTRVADVLDASVIVVGRGGAGHRGTVLFGHVTAELSFEAQRPVAIVPPAICGRRPVRAGGGESEQPDSAQTGVASR